MTSTTPEDPRNGDRRDPRASRDENGQTGSSASTRREPSRRMMKDRTPYPATNSAGSPVWGSAASAWNEFRDGDGSRWSTKRTIATAALALAVTGGATGAAFGLSSATETTSGSQGAGGAATGGEQDSATSGEENPAQGGNDNGDAAQGGQSGDSGDASQPSSGNGADGGTAPSGGTPPSGAPDGGNPPDSGQSGS